MNLAEDLRRQLEAFVQRRIGVNPEIDVLRLMVGSEALQRVPAGLSSFQLAQWVVGYSLTRGNPTVFLQVVAIGDPAKQLLDLDPLVQELKADSSKWVSGVGDGLWVPDGWPFIDRKPLRDALTAMAEGAGPPALSIEGPFGHGKETMAEYACYLAREAKSFVPLVLKLRTEPVPGLLASIATKLWMVLNQPPDTETTHAEPERQAVILARQLAEAALASPTPTWVVANVLDHTGLADEGVIAFLDDLVRLVHETPSLPQKLRILILCDQLSLLELKNLPPSEARFTLGQVSGIEVREWLEAATPGKPEDLYQLATDRVMLSLDTDNPRVERRLEILSRKCKDVQKTLAVADV
jgi:hypothetical protein